MPEFIVPFVVLVVFCISSIIQFACRIESQLQKIATILADFKK